MQCLFRSEFPALALQFRDYIRLRYAVELLIKEERDRWNQSFTAVYLPDNIENEDREAICRESEDFLRNPTDSRYEQAAWLRGDTRSLKYSIPVKTDKNFLLNLLIGIKQTKFTLFIILLCMLIYLLQNIGYQNEIFQTFHYPDSPEEKREIWRYLSHTVVHLNHPHILFNLLWWWIFAAMIERRVGTPALVMIYIISGVISAALQDWGLSTEFFGLSGVVYAVLGFVSAANSAAKDNLFNLPLGFNVMIIVSVLLGFLASSPLIRFYVAMYSHLGGLLCGIVLGCLYGKKILKNNKTRPLVNE
ncbi:GlpG protein [Mesocricetibacter intestinalis]|uniref:GlpG protein n=1 Tax=Mesocricetibacter intestinalis TaxID=1521930 RepID=A0A4R6VEE7_9PAST|nr:rhomboid family intramembrane serine protease [Mesocricetibacter intestinalis]TDQ59355.1 GlpG protein [Mesocricetibacter intestinalis]